MEKNLIYDREKRQIIYGGEIDGEMATKFTEAFLELSEDNYDITLICTGSVGGDWDNAGLGLCDLIRGSESYITMYGLGMQASTQALMFCAADSRILSPDGYIMLHDGSLAIDDSVENFKRMAAVTKKMCDMTYKHLAKISVKPASFFKEKMKEDWYIFSKEAVDLKLATSIGTP